jgi:hypothetical protein
MLKSTIKIISVVVGVILCAILLPEVVLGSLLFIVWAVWMVFLYLKVLKPMKQNKKSAERVRVSGKRNDWDNYVFAFEFSDGTVKELRLTDVRLFHAYRVGDTGMLTYKERENSKDYFSRVFISFEKDY